MGAPMALQNVETASPAFHVYERSVQASRLVDARRKHHDCTLVEYDLMFKPKIADRLQHRRLVRGPGCDDALAPRVVRSFFPAAR
jgi:hypothetical protein